MHEFRDRIHIRHYELRNSTVHVVWRLKATQAPLAPFERTIVLDVLGRGKGFGCIYHAAAIMDDHVHVLFRPGDARTSVEFVSSWKSNSSRLICKATIRSAPLWQRDFYQGWIRHPGQLAACISYIRANPQRRWPGIERYPWII